MWWAFVSVVGFAALNALVIWLARSNTARWERNHRAARATVVHREATTRRRQAEALVAAWRLPPDGGRGRLRRVLREHLPHVRAPYVRGPNVRAPRAGGPPLRGRRVGVPHVGLPHLHLPHVHLPDRVVARLRHRPGDRSGPGPHAEAAGPREPCSGAGPVGAGPEGAGPEGASRAGAGSASAGPESTGPRGAGPAGAGSEGAGVEGAGPEGAEAPPPAR